MCIGIYLFLLFLLCPWGEESKSGAAGYEARLRRILGVLPAYNGSPTIVGGIPPACHTTPTRVWELYGGSHCMSVGYALDAYGLSGLAGIAAPSSFWRPAADRNSKEELGNANLVGHICFRSLSLEGPTTAMEVVGEHIRLFLFARASHAIRSAATAGEDSLKP